MSAVLTPVAVEASECANCATALNGKFCHACGQRAHVHKSLLHMGEEVLHGVLHFDSKGLMTLPMLVAKPGKLTRSYIDGRRTRYVSPLALFLFMVVVMFSSASLLSGPNKAFKVVPMDPAAQMTKEIAAGKAKVARAKAQLAFAHVNGGSVAAAQKDVDDALEDQAALESGLEDIKSGTIGFSGKTGWKALDDALAHANQNRELTLYKLKGAGSKYSFLLVPISLPFLWLLFCRRRDLTLYDHAVFSLYSLSFMALLFSLLFILGRLGLGKLMLALLLCAPPVHMFVQLRGTYALGRWSALWRTAALMLIAGIVFTLYMVVVAMLSVN